MTRIMKVALASAMLIAGSSMTFAADGRNGVGGTGIGDKGRFDEQQKLLKQQELDDMSTGSIQPCDSQMWDQSGNCIADPDYQDAR